MSLICFSCATGATYSINVTAISYGLSSPEPHTYYQTLYPKPPESLQIVKFSNASILLSWQAPVDSLVDSYVVRFKPVGSSLWQEQSVVNNITSTEVHDLIAGEKYNFKINTVSNKIESLELRELEQTLYPNAIESVSQLTAANNITFKILTSLGRVDYYIVVYNTVKGKDLSIRRVALKFHMNRFFCKSFFRQLKGRTILQNCRTI